METTETRARPDAGAAAGAEPAPRGLTRRALLARGAAFGTTLIVGAGFVTARDAAWAVEVTTLKPETMATLIQMARDIYPHDRLADRFYAVAVKGYDDPAKAEMVEAGIAGLDAAARGRGFAPTPPRGGRATAPPSCRTSSAATSSRPCARGW